MAKRVWPSAIAVLLIVVGIGVYLVSCVRKPDDTTPPVIPVSEDMDPEVRAFEDERVAHERKLAEMPVPELAQELTADSNAQLEPFNSSAAREVRRRAKELTERKESVEPLALELAETIKAPDASSHVALLALFKLSPEIYNKVPRELRYRVLTDALSKAEYLNAWGVPHLFLTQPAGRAIIHEGRGIERYLYPVLDIDREAEVFGSAEIVSQHNAYKYRLKDYALGLIHAARGDTSFVMPQDPKERDVLIDRIKKEAAAARVTKLRAARSRKVSEPDCPPGETPIVATTAQQAAK